MIIWAVPLLTWISLSRSPCLPTQASCHFQIEKPNEISRRFAAFMVLCLRLSLALSLFQHFLNLFLSLHTPLAFYSLLPAASFECGLYGGQKKFIFCLFILYRVVLKKIDGGMKKRSLRSVAVFFKCHLFVPFLNICPSAESVSWLFNNISLQPTKIEGGIIILLLWIRC